ncbi:type I restriction-modification system subunit M [Rickettsia bellii]|uniref:site-specific DNA-methyltransferase (adenine-specific) n=2 Tax=Rickettsia bellii TaxID=33990 RepID=Q1RJH7_RICBR|nr:type I restriction-modification system subunit M [Rickettsia bellii]ABE04487.1 Type I restriction-modification system, M subunit [Rickettsia bellii RML369-C]
MTDQLKQNQINNAAWAACDTFRRVVDAANYKDYILVMLFFKYISDVWKAHKKECEERDKDEPSRIQSQLEREDFVIPKGANFYDIFVQREKSDSIGELINKALNEIEQKNLAKLKGVFRNVDFNSEFNLGKTKERNRRLKMLLEDFGKLELDLSPDRVNEDIIGECYIYLISRFASDAGKKAGEFYTPTAVSTLLAKLAAPKSGDIICDPACGSGSLLLRAAKEVGDNNYALYGQEMNNATWALAQMNMFLHSEGGAHIYWGDTLNHPEILENDKLMKFDIVIANPPFSLEKWGHENAANDNHKRFWRGIPPKTKGDYAFISHMIEVTKPLSGRAAIVVPHGVLFRGGTEGLIRQSLIEDNLLDAVIGLPANLFTSTGIPVAILVFDRSRETGGQNNQRKDVLFIDASSSFKAGKGQNFLEEEHINKIVDTYKNRKAIEKYSHLANIHEIRENKHNLNIPRYVDTYEEEEEIDVAELQKEIQQLEKELVEIRSQMDVHLKELGV